MEATNKKKDKIIDKIKKLLALADDSPFISERISSLNMARSLMEKHSISEDLFRKKPNTKTNTKSNAKSKAKPKSKTGYHETEAERKRKIWERDQRNQEYQRKQRERNEREEMDKRNKREEREDVFANILLATGLVIIFVSVFITEMIRSITSYFNNISHFLILAFVIIVILSIPVFLLLIIAESSREEYNDWDLEDYVD